MVRAVRKLDRCADGLRSGWHGAAGRLVLGIIGLGRGGSKAMARAAAARLINDCSMGKSSQIPMPH
jgi:hypothetical protein